MSAGVPNQPRKMTTASYPPALGGLRVDSADRSTLLFKMVLLGETGVGKTSLAARLSGRPVPAPHTPTIGIDFCHFTRCVDDTLVRINLWDTAGQERFHCLLSAYCRRAHAAIFVFDLTDVRTFHSINKSLRKVYETLPDDACKLLIGNKKDLADQGKRAVTSSMAEEWAEREGAQYVELSITDSRSDVEGALLEFLRQLMMTNYIWSASDHWLGIRKTKTRSNCSC